MSVNVFDAAHALARDLKNSDEFLDYKAFRDKVMQNDTNRAIIEQYNKLQFHLQVAMSTNSKPDPEKMEQLQKIAQVLQLSPDTSGYLLSEMRLQKMLADIYRLLGEAVEFDMGFMS